MTRDEPRRKPDASTSVRDGSSRRPSRARRGDLLTFMLRGPAKNASPPGGEERLQKRILVGGGAVEAGDGDVVEAEVAAELGAMVDDVVHHETA